MDLRRSEELANAKLDIPCQCAIYAEGRSLVSAAIKRMNLLLDYTDRTMDCLNREYFLEDGLPIEVE